MFLFLVIYNNSEKISSIKLLYLYPCSPQYKEINFANREREEIKMAEMKAFNSLAEGFIKSFDIARDAETAKDGKAVLSYMKANIEMNDEPYIRAAKFFCKVVSNAALSDYRKFRSTKKITDLFPESSNINEMREALNLVIKFLKKRGWKIAYFDDHVEWSFEKKYLVKEIIWKKWC